VEPLVTEPSAFEFEMAVVKLKRHKSPGSNQFPTETIKARGRTMLSEIHNLLILFVMKRNYLRSGRSQSLYLLIGVVKQIAVIIEAYHICQQHTQLHSVFYCQG
jgi:hypothetical protein